MLLQTLVCMFGISMEIIKIFVLEIGIFDYNFISHFLPQLHTFCVKSMRASCVPVGESRITMGGNWESDDLC